MGGLQPDVEPLGVRRRERPADHADQTVETGRAHVQQVSAIVSVDRIYQLVVVVVVPVHRTNLLKPLAVLQRRGVCLHMRCAIHLRTMCLHNNALYVFR